MHRNKILYGIFFIIHGLIPLSGGHRGFDRQRFVGINTWIWLPHTLILPEYQEMPDFFLISSRVSRASCDPLKFFEMLKAFSRTSSACLNCLFLYNAMPK
jgi:hypothetical protein